MDDDNINFPFLAKLDMRALFANGRLPDDFLSGKKALAQKAVFDVPDDAFMPGAVDDTIEPRATASAPAVMGDVTGAASSSSSKTRVKSDPLAKTGV